MRAHNNMEEQVSEAKEMLSSKDSQQKEEAVRILIEISRQGRNNEATDLLAKCLEESQGITPETEDDVKWCVKIAEEEKRLRYAVEQLYNSVKKDGEDKVAIQDINKAMKRAKEKQKETDTQEGNNSPEELGKKEKKEMSEEVGLMTLLINALTVGRKDEFTLAELKDTVMAYARGDVPEVVTLLSKEDMDKFNKASILEKVMKYPDQSLESAKHFILVKISKKGSTFLKSLIPTSQIQMLVLLYVYSQLTADFLWFIIPLIIFYICFLSLVVFSLQMFYGREALRQLRSVSELMKKFDPRLNSSEAENKFMWNSVTPYISFFIVLLVTVAVFPLCDKLWIPCSELSLVALFFTVSSFRGLPDKYDNYALYTILLKLLTTILCSLGNVRGLAFLYYPILVVPLRCGLEFDISLPSILRVIILVLLLIMVSRHPWRGIYKVLIPYLVCLLWWQLFSELFHFTTWSSLLRATLGWVIFVTTLPLLILFTIGLSVTYFVQWFMSLDLAFKLAVTAAVVAFSSAMFYYSKLEIPYGEKLKRKKKLIIILTGSVVVGLLLPVVYVNFVPSIYGPPKVLSWKEYNDSCVRITKGGEVNIAAVQIRCNEFQGESVNWTGTVADVKLSSVENRFRPLVTYLPRFLQPSLKCLLGEEMNTGGERSTEARWWLPKAKGPCHLRTYDRYTFSVGVKMSTDAAPQREEVVRVTVTHRFYHTVVTLQENTQITFQGRLGSGPPYVTVTAKRLFINGTKVKPRIGLGRDDIFEGLRDSGRFIIRFFMTPLINERDYDEDDV